MNNLTPEVIRRGDRLVCRFATGALLLRPTRWYTVALVLQSSTGRMLELEELPGLFYPAWRFMAHEPSRFRVYRRAEPADAAALAAAVAQQDATIFRRSDDPDCEAELACPAAV